MMENLILKDNEFPETLDLEKHALEATNAMLNMADEDYEYIPFFNANLIAKPAYMVHGNWDFGSSHGRLVDSLILARQMNGIDEPFEIEKYYRKNLLSFFREDGLNYRRNTFTEDEIKAHLSTFKESASMIDQRAVLMGLTTWFMETKEERIKEYADRLCSALKKIARKERDGWYYPASEFTSHGWPSFDAVHTRLAVDPAAMWGRQIGPLLRYYLITGNKDAYELADRFVSNIIYRSGVFNKDGSFNPALEYRNAHLHTRLGTLASLAKYAIYNNDSQIIEFVKKSYDWVIKEICTSFGWMPGDLYDQKYEHETCALVDAIDIGINLARCGYFEYWGVVQKFVINHLIESQLLNVDWIEDLNTKEKDIPKRLTYYKVAERVRGSFGGYTAPNDLVYSGEWGRGHVMDIQMCCNASGVRGLYIVWDSIVTKRNNTVFVNLLLNKAHSLLDVKSYLPYIGKIQLNINKDITELAIRIPEWAPIGTVNITKIRGENISKINGRDLPWLKKQFILLKDLREKDIVIVTFELQRKTTYELASGLEYKVEWLGDFVVNISPEGKYYPLYSNRVLKTNIPTKKKLVMRKYESLV